MIDETLIEDISETWNYVRDDITHEQMYLSMEKCLKTRIYVEGTADKKFFEGYLRKGIKLNCNVETISKIKNSSKLQKENNKPAYIKVIGFVKNTDGAYGIIDADYNLDDKNEYLKKPGLNIENRVKIIEAHSIETLMMRYLYFDAKKFITIVQQSLNIKLTEEVASKIIQKAWEFSFQIGLLRKEYPTAFNYKAIKSTPNCFFYRKLVKTDGKEIIFKKKTFLQDLFNYQIESLPKIKNSKSKVTIEYLTELTNNNFDQTVAYAICQGHDLMNFIEALLLLEDESLKINHENNNEETDFENNFIKNYPYDCFLESPTSDWLLKINGIYRVKDK